MDRFWSKVDRASDPNGCWLWTAHINKRTGYGMFAHGERRQPNGNSIPEGAHRTAWRLSGRTLTPGMTLDHLCRVRHCVNPDHLEEVTQGENVRRAVAAKPRQTHCRKGHPYTRTDSAGYGRCEPCYRARHPTKPKRTTCPNGHPLTPENRYVRANGWTFCKPCTRAAQRRR